MAPTAANLTHSSMAAQSTYLASSFETSVCTHCSRSTAAMTDNAPPMKAKIMRNFGSGCSASSRIQNHSQMRDGMRPMASAYGNVVRTDMEIVYLDSAGHGSNLPVLTVKQRQ